jgi:hypothetical protein
VVLKTINDELMKRSCFTDTYLVVEDWLSQPASVVLADLESFLHVCNALRPVRQCASASCHASSDDWVQRVVTTTMGVRALHHASGSSRV